MWLVAELLDQPVHVRHGHAEGRAGLRDDVFLDHDAAEIVRAVFNATWPISRPCVPTSFGCSENYRGKSPRQCLRPQILVRTRPSALSISCARPETSSRMNAVKCPGLMPLPSNSATRFKEISCCVRKRSRCSMRSSIVSTWPKHHRRAGNTNQAGAPRP